MLYEDWMVDIKEKGLPINPDFKFEELLSSAVEIS